MVRWKSLVTLALALSASSFAAADKWPDSYWSAYRRFHLDVSDKLTLRDTTSGVVRWAVPFPQASRPRYAFITDDGSRTVLQDYQRTGRHGESGGNGKSIVFLNDSGQVLRDYRPQDLLSNWELQGLGYRARGQQIIYVPENRVWLDADGRFNLVCLTMGTFDTHSNLVPLMFDVKTGEELSATPEDEERMRLHAADMNRPLLESKDEDQIYLALLDARFLRDANALPRLKQLARDPDSETRNDAILAINETSPQDALLLVAEQLDKGPDVPATYLLSLFNTNKQPLDNSTLSFLLANTTAGCAEIALDNLQLFHPERALAEARKLTLSDDAGVRRDAFRFVSDHGTEKDIPLLKQNLLDKEVWYMCLRGLVRLNPRDIDAILQSTSAQKQNVDAWWEATIDLCDRGDAKAQKEVVAWVAQVGKDKDSGGYEQLQQACFALAKQKPAGANEALMSTLDVEKKRFYCDVDVRGALAALGHDEFLPFLRDIAINGTPSPMNDAGDKIDDFRRVEAMIWLRTLGDDESKAILQGLTHHRNPGVRNVAVDLLKDMAKQ